MRGYGFRRSATWIAKFLVLGLLFSRAVSGGEECRHAVVIVGVGVDTGVVARACDFVARNSGAAVRVKIERPAGGKTLKEILGGIEFSTNDITVVLFAAPAHPSMLIMKQRRVACVDVGVLEAKAEGDSNPHETFCRRVEREAMRGLGLLLGLPVCPNGRCVLSEHVDLEGLDKKGRNFCPPCLFRAQGLLEKAGVAISDEPAGG
jgi:hypothetical protein